MKLPLSSRFIAAAVLAAAALGAASAAQAHPDIQFSIGLPGLPFFVPPPVFLRAEPVYVQPRQYYAPAPIVYERDSQSSYQPEDDREWGWQHDGWQRHEWERRESQRRESQRREWQRREWEHSYHDQSSSHDDDGD